MSVADGVALFSLALCALATSVDGAKVVRSANNTGSVKVNTMSGTGAKDSDAAEYTCPPDQAIVTLLADNQKYLTVCNGSANPPASGQAYTVDFHEADRGAAWAQWMVYKLPGGKVALKNVGYGQFLARCNGCYPNGAYPDAAFVHITEANVLTSPFAQWTLMPVSSGKVTLQADTGKYLARCNGCVSTYVPQYPDQAFVHVSDPTQSSAQFVLDITPTASPTLAPTVMPTSTPTAKPTSSPTLVPTSTPTLMPTSTPTAKPTSTPTSMPTSSPTLMPTPTPTLAPTATPTSTPSAKPTSSPTLTPTFTPTSTPTGNPTSSPTWMPTSTPTMVFWDRSIVTLGADNKKYLTVCNGCANPRPAGQAYTVDFHEPDRSVTWAQWMVYNLPNGKVALKNVGYGQFLARCNGCYPDGAYVDAAFVYVTEAGLSHPPAQWTVTRLPSGKVTLMADTGNYLARCNGCVPTYQYPDTAFIHVSDPTKSSAQFVLGFIFEATPTPTMKPTSIPTVMPTSTPTLLGGSWAQV